MELFQQKKEEYRKDVELLQDIAMEFHAKRELERLLALEEAMDHEYTGMEQGESNLESLEARLEAVLAEDKRRLNKIAGNLLLNCLETHLITAVMNGEDMEDKLKLLNPKFIHARKRLENQVFSEKQKIERMVVKYVMNYEADYHIMLRKIREEIKSYNGLMEALTINSEVNQIAERQENWCLSKIAVDMQELEKEILSFSREISRTENKCRQDTIQIMNNNLFSIIAKKTESALQMIHYENGPEESKMTKETWQQLAQKLFSGIKLSFDLEKDLADWTKKLEQQKTDNDDTSELLKKLSQEVHHEVLKYEGRSKKAYNDFLKKYVRDIMNQIQEEATDYLEALQNQLFEDLDIRKAQKEVDRATLEHLVEVRNKIVRTLEEN